MNQTTEQRTVLVVDDDQDYLMTQQIQLEAAGYKVFTAQSKSDAEKILEEIEPDAAVVDLMMEDMDAGFTLCFSIKRKYPDVPIILVSAVASETGLEFDATTTEERSWVKADAFLAKPVRFEQLQHEIERLVETKK